MSARPAPRWWHGLLAAFAPLRQRWMLVDGAWSSVPSQPADVAADPPTDAHPARQSRPSHHRQAA
jgi:hypothetical protein